MKSKKLFCKIITCTLALVLIAPAAFVPVNVYAAGFPDISGHWAEQYIKSAVDKGIVKGYSDGTFKPNKAVTRAEFASMVNKALGNTGTASTSFYDVPSSEWYFTDISKAVAAAYVSGYDDNSFKPNSPITREEAAVMISRIVPSYGAAGNLSEFGDNGSISDWAYSGLLKSNGKGYIGAYSDGNLHPKDMLTRAQTAKIICDITEKETIVADTPSIKSSTTLAGKIYSNGVNIHRDLADNNATIDNCVIMGNLTIQGGGSNSIVINHSRVADCSVEKSGSSVRVVAYGETCILNTDVSYTAKLETSNLTGGNPGIGFAKINAGGSSSLSLAGSFPNVTLTGPSSNVKLESGTITVLNVGSSAGNSKITVDSNGTITTANVNSTVSFHGTGIIRTLNANANSITYETKPYDINNASGVTIQPAETDAVSKITFDPASGAKNVAVNKKITITFTQEMIKYNGQAITSSDLEDIISFTKDSKTGSKIAFSASISSTKKVITITPDNNLTADVTYYVSFDRNAFKDKTGMGNEAQSIYFTVGTGSVDGVAFSPSNGATGVSTSAEPTITFDNAIEKYAGGDLTASYLKNNIEFRLNSSSGSEVSFTASINSKSKIITIVPDMAMTTGQKYYLGFDSKIFRTASDDKSVSGQYVTWTVGNAAAPAVSFTPANSSSNVSVSTNITITFAQRVFNTSGSVPTTSNVSSAVTIRDNTAGSNITYSSQITDKTSSTVFTLNPTNDFTAGHSYTVTVSANQFKNSGGTYSASASSSFTAAGSVDVSAITAAVTRAETAKKDVQVSDNGLNVYNDTYWVTSSQMTALNNAITSANIAKTTVMTTAQSTAEANTLDAATSVFTKAKQLGLKVKIDTTVIDTAINNANSAKAGIVTSSVNGTDVDPTSQWVSQEVMSALVAAIDTATKAKDTVQTVAAADEAAAALNSKVKTFNDQKAYGRKVIVNKSGLSSDINDAKNLKKSTVVSTDGTDVTTDKFWVLSSSIIATFEASISAAEAVLANPSATQTEVDNAVDALNSATDTFTDPNTRKPGTKVS